jgi:hypothetical protein
MAKSVLSDKRFHDEATAFAFVEAKLWPQGPVCPKCGGEGYPLEGVRGKPKIDKKTGKVIAEGKVRIGLKKCRACRAQFTVRMNTIFEDSHIPLHLWLQAMALMSSSKKGISANQMHRTLGITLKTAWFLEHRIRMAMAPSTKLPPMGGAGKIVEIDETYHGKVAVPETTRADGTPFKTRTLRGHGGGRGPSNKRPIVALIERGGQARTFHVANADVATVGKIVRDNVDRQSKVHTDASHLYVTVGREFADHGRVQHSLGEYVRYENGEAVHNNSCESYFSVFKRGMTGTYQWCAEKHLHRYLAEFEFRFNNRTALGVDDVSRADALLAGVTGKRLTFRTTGRA